MKQTFSDQLSVWRTANGVATMKKVLEENSTIVNTGNGNVKIVRPHAFIKTGDVKVLSAYVQFKLSLIKLVGSLRHAIHHNDAMEVELLKADIVKINKQFFDAVRSATGYENFMGIDHDNSLVVDEEGKKHLAIHLFPIQADGQHYKLQVVEFNKGDEKVGLPCMIIPVPKQKKKKKKVKK